MEATCCAIDCSGSMANCLNDTIGGFNLFLDNQPKDSLLSTYLFDNTVKLFQTLTTAEKAKRLDKTNYRPCGGTALLDAIGHAITIASNCTTGTINILILTDGEENSSKNYTKSQVFKMIEDRKKEGWNFIFLGANQDAIKVAESYGIPRGGAMTFDINCVDQVFRSTSEALGRARFGSTQGVEFSNLERVSSCPCADT